MFEHERLLENHLSVNSSSMKISYQNNVFNNSFNNFNAILTIFKSSGNFIEVCTTTPFS